MLFCMKVKVFCRFERTRSREEKEVGQLLASDKKTIYMFIIKCQIN